LRRRYRALARIPALSAAAQVAQEAEVLCGRMADTPVDILNAQSVYCFYDTLAFKNINNLLISP
jgi:hypothetical protein